MIDFMELSAKKREWGLHNGGSGSKRNERLILVLSFLLQKF